MIPLPPDSLYRVLRPVGHGGIGSVYLGERRSDRQRVALKFIPASPGQSPGLKEFSMAMALRHPGIVRCLDFLYLGGGTGTILVYEWMEGGSLRDLLNLGYRPTFAWATRAFCELLLALDYLHEQGQVHCDLKPENILLSDVDPDNTAFRLADLGSSQFAARQGWRQEQPAASPAYLAPEVLYDEFDGTADLYSLGLVYAELLGGRRVFDGTPRELLQAHLHQAPDLAHLPHEGARALVARLLRKQPAERPRRAAEVLDVAQGLLHGRGAAPLLPAPAPAEPARTVMESVVPRSFRRTQLLERLDLVRLPGRPDGLWGLNRHRLPFLLAERPESCEAHATLLADGLAGVRPKSGPSPFVQAGSHVLYQHEGKIRRWSPPDGPDEVLLEHAPRVQALRLSANGRYLLLAGTAQTLLVERRTDRRQTIPWPHYGTGTQMAVLDDGGLFRCTSLGQPVAEWADAAGRTLGKWPLQGLLVSASPFAEPAFCVCAGGRDGFALHSFHCGQWRARALPAERVRAFAYAHPHLVVLLHTGEVLRVGPELDVEPAGQVGPGTVAVVFSPDNVFCYEVAPVGADTAVTTYFNHGN